MKKPSTLAAKAAAVTKTILGADLAKPEVVQMPKAIHEIHVSIDEVIPAGIVITDEIAELAGLSEDDVADLAEKGAIVMVDVLAAALPATAA